MTETRELLRPAVEGFEPMPDAFERVLNRRDRKQRNRSVAAGIVGVAIFALAALGLARLLTSEPRPAVPPTPSGKQRPVFERTTTIGGLTVTSPSDWPLVNYWGGFDVDAVSLDDHAMPLLEVTNFDAGLGKPVCDTQPGQPSRLPDDGVAVFVIVGSDGRDVTDLCGGKVDDSSSGQIPDDYRIVMTSGPDASAEDLASAQAIMQSFAWNRMTFYVRGESPGYVLDGWVEGSSVWLLEARPAEGKVRLTTTEYSTDGSRGSSDNTFDLPASDAIEGDFFGAVTEDAASVEFHRYAGGQQPLVARLIDLPPSLSFPFDAYVFEPGPPGTPTGEVVAVGEGGHEIGSNLPPLVDTVRAGTVRAFGTRWIVKASFEGPGGYLPIACVQRASEATSAPCERGPYVQTFDGPHKAVFLSVVMSVAGLEVRADAGTLFHPVLLPLDRQGSPDTKVAVIALEGAGPGHMIYHYGEDQIDDHTKVEWPDLGQVIGEGSFPPPD